VERLTGADRACALAAALARDFNDELTVILSSASNALMALEPGHPARPAVFEMRSSAHRCARKCAELAIFNHRHGRQAPRASLAALLEL
jgi:hypothetical protein